MKHADIFSQVIKQVKQSKFTPSAAFMNINGEVIDILDKKNRKIVSKYLKINELSKH
jgi:rubrerythrin